MHLWDGEIRMNQIGKIYNSNELILTDNEFEILIFKPGYEILVEKYIK